MNTRTISLISRALREASRALTELDGVADHHDAALIDRALTALNKAKPTRIVIEVEGGLVQNVYSSDKVASVSLLDRDVDEVEEPDDERRELVTRLTKEIKGLHEVFWC